MPRPATTPTWATDANYPAGSSPWSATPTRVEPDVGDQAAGLEPATRPPAQWLNWLFGLISDWIAYLRDERDRLDAYCSSSGVLLPAAVTTIRYLGTHAMAFKVTLTAAAPQWSRFDDNCRSEADLASGYFNLTPLLPRNATIQRIRVLVDPGIARATLGNRMQAQLLRHTYGVSFTTPVTSAIPSVATARDDGTTQKQWILIDLTGAPVAVGDGAAWTLWVIAGSDAATNKDAVYDAMVEFTCTTIRNG